MVTRKRFSYEYPRPAVTVDCVVFALDLDELKVLLIQRDHDPHAGFWAIPGGFVDENESLEGAARRELEEETGLRIGFLEQLYTFGEVGRDPRGRVITVAYWALVRRSRHRPRAASDARQANWFALRELPSLAFDHARILEVARDRLRAKVRYQPIGFELLPAKFSLGRLQQLYETILDRPLDKRNFRRKILKMGILVELEETQRGVRHRAARLYRFDRPAYNRLCREGSDFAL